MISSKHISYLDSTRGIAALSVVLLHFLVITYPMVIYGSSGKWEDCFMFFPFSFFISGRSAVCLFFILSGFVLSYRFIGERGFKWKIIESIIKRPARLSGVIIFTQLPLLSFFFTKDFWTRGIFADYYIFLKAWYNVFSVFFSTNCIYSITNPPLWTIYFELWGSLITFGICFLIGNINKYIRLIIALLLFVYFMRDYYCAFILGIVIADLHKNWNIAWFIKYKNMISWFVIVPAVILFSYPAYLDTRIQYWTNVQYIMDGYMMIGAILMFVFIMCNDKIKILLEYKPFVFIGNISYSVYVIHWLLITYYAIDIYNFIICFIASNNCLAFFIAFAIILTIIILESYLIDKFIDKPCIKIASWFGESINFAMQKSVKIFIFWVNSIKCLRAQKKVQINATVEKDNITFPTSNN